LSFDGRKKLAEIKYAALIAEKNILYQMAKEILNFFHVGKEPNVLNMGRTKYTNIITNAVCPVEINCVVNTPYST